MGVFGHAYFPRHVLCLPSRFHLLQRPNDLRLRVPGSWDMLSPLLNSEIIFNIVGEQVKPAFVTDRVL